jgi:uncharacterized protein
MSGLVGPLHDHVLNTSAARRLVSGLRGLMPEPQIRVNRVTVRAQGLPTRLDGLRLLQVSDLHLRAGSQLALALPEVVCGLGHDIVLYTGDFIDDDDGIADIEGLLDRLPRSPSFAVFGNHDHWKLGGRGVRNDIARLAATLQRCGVHVLHNTALIALDGHLCVAGVDDPVTGNDDLAGAFGQVPDGVWTILLSHTPDILLRLDGRKPELVLAGHTHGGQVRLPLIGPLFRMCRLPRRAVMGLHSYNGVPFYVTTGVGYAGVDLRVGCPPEVALLTLAADSPGTSRRGQREAVSHQDHLHRDSRGAGVPRVDRDLG